jgi:hypothetical protein
VVAARTCRPRQIVPKLASSTCSWGRAAPVSRSRPDLRCDVSNTTRTTDVAVIDLAFADAGPHSARSYARRPAARPCARLRRGWKIGNAGISEITGPGWHPPVRGRAGADRDVQRVEVRETEPRAAAWGVAGQTQAIEAGHAGGPRNRRSWVSKHVRRCSPTGRGAAAGWIARQPKRSSILRARAWSRARADIMRSVPSIVCSNSFSCTSSHTRRPTTAPINGKTMNAQS